MPRSFTIFIIFIIWSVTTSIFSLFLIKTGLNTPLVFAIKDGFIFLIFFIFIYHWIWTEKFFILCLLIFFLLCYCVINTIVLNEEYIAPLSNIRQILSPLALLLIFSGIKLNDEESSKIWKYARLIVYIVFLFGIIEMLFSIWETINLSEYFSLKGIPVSPEGLSYMFYEPMLGYSKRMTSFFLDPISLGHFFATAMCAFFYINKHSLGYLKSPIFIICFSGIILSFSKGAMLQAFIGMVLFNKNLYYSFRLILCFIPFLVLDLIPESAKSGLNIHFEGTSNSLTSLTLFGHGIGSSGNYSKMFSNDLSLYYHLGISDTYLGAIMGQTGLFGLLMWLAIAWVIIYSYSKYRSNLFTASKLFFSIVIVSLLSENTLNVTSFLFPALLISLCTRNLRTIN